MNVCVSIYNKQRSVIAIQSVLWTLEHSPLALVCWYQLKWGCDHFHIDRYQLSTGNPGEWLEEQIDKSIADTEPVDRWRYVYDSSLGRQRSDTSNIDSVVWQLESLHPQSILWALKSPNKRKGGK